MPLEYFEDLMANEELRFNRADKFKQDEQEGIPPDQYLRRVLNTKRYDPAEELNLVHHIGSLAQDRESFFVNCWHLHRHETLEMWRGFGRDGVAICSRYSLLRKALDGLLDRTFLGLVRYGEEHLHSYNILEFIYSKRLEFVNEREVRALIWCPGLTSGGATHIDSNNVPHTRPRPEYPPKTWMREFKWRRIDLKALLIGVVVSPFAGDSAIETARHWGNVRKLECEPRQSSLKIG